MLDQRFEFVFPEADILNQLDNGEPPSIALAMLRSVRLNPNRPAFCRVSADSAEELQWFSWGQIAQWVCDACRSIEAVLPNSNETHIASVASNSVEWFVLDFACQVLGHVHVAIDPKWPDAMIDRLLELSDSRIAFSNRREYSTRFGSSHRVINLEWKVNWEARGIGSDDLEKLVERAKVIQFDAPAQILFTSGTSGEPKAVLLSHRNLLCNALAKLDAAPQFEQDIRLNILPFCHAYARTCELSTWVLSKSRLAIASDWGDFLQQAILLEPTLINLVPYLANKLVIDEDTKQRIAPENIVRRLGGKVRLLQVGGAAIPDSLWYELDACGLAPLQGYGLTEASPVVCSNRTGKQRPGTIGPPVAGVELRVDADKQLWVRGDGVMCGYYRDRAATEARIQDGWLATGDLVEQDDYGHYRLLGRHSEVIVLSTGFKVSPELIEARITNLPWIDRVLIAGQDRPFIVAIIWPAWTALPANLFDGISRNHSSLKMADFNNAMKDHTQQCLADLPVFMHPRKFVVQAKSIDLEPDLLNAKGGLRRKVVVARMQTQIDEAYE